MLVCAAPCAWEAQTPSSLGCLQHGSRALQHTLRSRSDKTDEALSEMMSDTRLACCRRQCRSTPRRACSHSFSLWWEPKKPHCLMRASSPAQQPLERSRMPLLRQAIDGKSARGTFDVQTPLGRAGEFSLFFHLAAASNSGANKQQTPNQLWSNSAGVQLHLTSACAADAAAVTLASCGGLRRPTLPRVKQPVTPHHHYRGDLPRVRMRQQTWQRAQGPGAHS